MDVGQILIGVFCTAFLGVQGWILMSVVGLKTEIAELKAHLTYCQFFRKNEPMEGKKYANGIEIQKTA